MMSLYAMDVHSLAERPDLFDEAFDLPYGDADGAAFMQESMAGLLVRASRLARLWPAHVLVIVVGGRVVARAVSVPFSSTRDDREPFPDGGWDQVATWAAEDALDAVPVDTACALEIAVDPSQRGRGLSGFALDATRRCLRAVGIGRLVAPVRPPGKSEHPFEPMADYVRRRRADGSFHDWWLRVHERAGGTMVCVAPCSATIQAPLAAWRRWTGLPFDTDGEVAVPGGLAPVLVSTGQDLGVYVEPNVWFEYRT